MKEHNDTFIDAESLMALSDKKTASGGKRKYLSKKLNEQKSQADLWVYIQELLERNDASVEDLIMDIYDISTTAQSQNAQGDVIDDANARLKAKKMLLELAGVYKPKQVEVKVNLLQYVCWE